MCVRVCVTCVLPGAHCFTSPCEILSGCGVVWSAADLFYRSSSVLYWNISSLWLWKFVLDFFCICAVEMFFGGSFSSFDCVSWICRQGVFLFLFFFVDFLPPVLYGISGVFKCLALPPFKDDQRCGLDCTY